MRTNFINRNNILFAIFVLNIILSIFNNVDACGIKRKPKNSNCNENHGHDHGHDHDHDHDHNRN